MMTYKDILIVEDINGWFVVGHNSMGPFTSRDTAIHLGQCLLAILRMSTVRAQLYIFERDPRAGAPAAPLSAAAMAAGKRLTADLDSDISPALGAILFRQTNHRDGSRSFQRDERDGDPLICGSSAKSRRDRVLDAMDAAHSLGRLVES